MNNAKRVATYAFVILAVLLITPTALAAPFQLGLLSDEQRNVVLAMAIFFGGRDSPTQLSESDGSVIWGLKLSVNPPVWQAIRRLATPS